MPHPLNGQLSEVVFIVLLVTWRPVVLELPPASNFLTDVIRRVTLSLKITSLEDHF